jgi:Arc/MetJ-type ribon-helix-helix transcriptional regulator
MYEQLVELANRKKISVSNVIRQALEKVLNETQELAETQAKQVQETVE